MRTIKAIFTALIALVIVSWAFYLIIARAGTSRLQAVEIDSVLVQCGQVDYHKPPEQLIKDECEAYDIDYRLPLAIAELETGHFTSNLFVDYNNYGGMWNGEFMKFSTAEKGAEAFIENIVTNYYNKGLTTPAAMQPVYCPDEPEWAGEVESLMCR